MLSSPLVKINKTVEKDSADALKLIDKTADTIERLFDKQTKVNKDLIKILSGVQENIGGLHLQEMSETIFRLQNQVNALIETHPNRQQVEALIERQDNVSE